LSQPETMKRFFLFISIVTALFCLCAKVYAQGNQTVANGAATAPVNLPGGSCIYKWTNDKPGIGLPASGMGSIASFTAINNGASAVTATITATPVPNGFAYVTVCGGNYVSVISTATDKWVATIPVGNRPVSSVVSPDGSRVYIVDSASRDVQIINTATNKVIKTIPVGKSSFNEVISPDGKWLYVVNTGDKNIAVINTSTGTVTAGMPVTAAPYDIAISPDGSKLYLTYGYAKPAITVISTATQKVITDIQADTYSDILEIAVSPDGSRVYATDNGTSQVYVIDAATNTVITTFYLNQYPMALAFSPNGSRLYIGTANYQKNIWVVNTATNTVIDTIDTHTSAADTTDIINPSPRGMAVTPDGTKIITTTDVYGEIEVINVAAKAVEANIVAGDTPDSFHNFVTGAVSCGNPPIKFTITVTPTATPPPIITAGTVTGRLLVCANNDANSTHIQQFTANGINLTGALTVTAPAGFEVSLTAGSGYVATITIPPGGGVVNTVVYVRAVASVTPGDITGNVVLSSPEAVTQQVAVNGTVMALPQLKVVPNQTVNNGDTTTTVKFPNNTSTVNWTNDTPGIGLAASGTGNIRSFTAVNTGTKPIKATITATPVPAAIAYVANNKSNNISVINTSTNTVIDSIAAGEWPRAVAVSKDGSRAYVIDYGIISVIDTHVNQVIAAIPVFFYGPQALVVSPDGNWLYVSIGGSAGIEEITIINTNTNTVVDNIHLIDGMYDIAISPDGNTLYGVCPSSNTLCVINIKTKQVTAVVPVGKQPAALVLSPDGSRLYVANSIDGTISVINTSSKLVIGTISVGQDPASLTISPDGSRVYSSNSGFGYYGGASDLSTVSVINTANNTVIATIPVGVWAQGISITPDGSEVYVANSGYQVYGAILPGTVSVINTSTNTATNTLNVGTYPLGFGNFISPGEGCSGAPVTFTITVNPTPLITASAVTGNITACEGTASASPNIEQFTVSGINLTGDITLTTPPGGAFELSLSAGSGYSNSLTLTPVAGAVNNTVVYVRSTAAAPAGSLNGKVLVASVGALSQNVAVTGTVTAIGAPSIHIDASGNNICAGTPVTFTASMTNPGNTPVYQWTINGIATGTNSTTFTSTSLANGDVVTCLLSSSSPCALPANVSSNSITMTVFPEVNPEVTIAASANNICAGTPVTFTATPAPGAGTPSYQWLLNGGNAGTNNSTFTSAGFGNGDIISCVITSDAPCVTPANATSNSVTMNVDVPPVVHAGGNKSIAIGSSVLLKATTTANVTDVAWSPAAGLSSTKILQPVASPAITTTYTLLVKTRNGCVGIDSATVKVLLPDVIIPNTFTPNGDGINDTWNIKNLDLYQSCTVQVYNRWGQNVYTSIGYGTPWDGTYKGAPLPAGSYYYVIDLKNGGALLSGFVAIIR